MSETPSADQLEEDSVDDEPQRHDVDETSEQSFPSSDPPSTWAGDDDS